MTSYLSLSLLHPICGSPTPVMNNWWRYETIVVFYATAAQALLDQFDRKPSFRFPLQRDHHIPALLYQHHPILPQINHPSSSPSSPQSFPHHPFHIEFVATTTRSIITMETFCMAIPTSEIKSSAHASSPTLSIIDKNLCDPVNPL
jgi:hypothetical protein